MLLCFLPVMPNAWASDFPLPLALAPQTASPLKNLANKNFQKTLEYTLSQNKTWQKLIREKKMTVGLVDLSDPGHIMFARINGGGNDVCGQSAQNRRAAGSLSLF